MQGLVGVLQDLRIFRARFSRIFVYDEHRFVLEVLSVLDDAFPGFAYLQYFNISSIALAESLSRKMDFDSHDSSDDWPLSLCNWRNEQDSPDRILRSNWPLFLLRPPGRQWLPIVVIGARKEQKRLGIRVRDQGTWRQWQREDRLGSESSSMLGLSTLW